MIAELVRLALHAVVVAAPSWTLWLGLTTFMTAVGTLLLFHEQCRCRTYIAILEAIPPDTVLLDRTHRRRETVIVRLPQSRLIEHGNSADRESPGR